MASTECIHPSRIELGQSSSGLAVWRIPGQFPYQLKVFLEVRVKSCEWRTVAPLLDSVGFPFLLLLYWREFSPSGKDSSCQHGLPFKDFEGKPSSNLRAVSCK